MFTKIGKDITLQDQQQRVARKLMDPDTRGLIAWHSLGSGKTLTALNAAQNLLNTPGENESDKDKLKKILAIVPAPLVNNMYKEVEKHHLNIPKDKFDVKSYDSAVNHINDLLQNKYKLTILDEGHKLRNTNTERYKKLKRLLLNNSDKNLILTGTATYNKINDLLPLVHLISDPKDKNLQKILPSDPREFEKQYLGTKKIKFGLIDRFFKGAPNDVTVPYVKNKDLLGDTLAKYIDYHNSLDVNPEDFPTLNEKQYNVDLDSKQKTMYNYMLGKLPFLLKKKIQWGLPLSKSESKGLNAFSTGIRQVSDSVTPYNKDGSITTSPKINLAVNNLVQKLKENPNHRAIVYSNYISAGLDPYSKRLTELGIPHLVYTGKLNDKQRKEIVNNFNSLDNDTDANKPKVLLLSSSGGEGLDLKGVRQVQILEPHFNKSKIDQVVGRARRYRSHHHLPENERNVDVEYYHSTIPRGFFDKIRFAKPTMGIDEYLHQSSLQKDELTQQIIDSIKKRNNLA
jgi:SNF2 family DNA or RNA helicase